MPLQKLADVFPEVPLVLKLALLIIPILPNLWCIFQARSKNFPHPAEGRIWLLVGMFLPVLGGLLYLFWGRKRVVRA